MSTICNCNYLTLSLLCRPTTVLLIWLEMSWSVRVTCVKYCYFFIISVIGSSAFVQLGPLCMVCSDVDDSTCSDTYYYMSEHVTGCDYNDRGCSKQKIEVKFSGIAFKTSKGVVLYKIYRMSLRFLYFYYRHNNRNYCPFLLLVESNIKDCNMIFIISFSRLPFGQGKKCQYYLQ